MGRDQHLFTLQCTFEPMRKVAIFLMERRACRQKNPLSG